MKKHLALLLVLTCFGGVSTARAGDSIFPDPMKELDQKLERQNPAFKAYHMLDEDEKEDKKEDDVKYITPRKSIEPASPFDHHTRSNAEILHMQLEEIR